MSISKIYNEKVIKNLENTVKDQRKKVATCKKNKKYEQELLNMYEKLLLDKYKTLEKTIFEDINM